MNIKLFNLNFDFKLESQWIYHNPSHHVQEKYIIQINMNES